MGIWGLPLLAEVSEIKEASLLGLTTGHPPSSTAHTPTSFLASPWGIALSADDENEISTICKLARQKAFKEGKVVVLN